MNPTNTPTKLEQEEKPWRRETCFFLVGESLYFWLAALLWATDPIVSPDSVLVDAARFGIASSHLHNPSPEPDLLFFWALTRALIGPLLEALAFLAAKNTLGSWLCGLSLRRLSGEPASRVRGAARSLAQIPFLGAACFMWFALESHVSSGCVILAIAIAWAWVVFLRFKAWPSGAARASLLDRWTKTREQVHHRPSIVDRRAFFVISLAWHLALLGALQPVRRWCYETERQSLGLPISDEPARQPYLPPP